MTDPTTTTSQPAPETEVEGIPGGTPSRKAWRRFCRNRPALLSMVVLGLVLAFMGIWSLWSPYSATQLSEAQFESPGSLYWLGTDAHGRDVLTRLIYGARISLVVGLLGAGLSLIIGVTWGATAGYLGGHWDNLMMRVVDVLYSVPSIIFVVVFMATFEIAFKEWLESIAATPQATLVRLGSLVLALGGISWLTMARIVRGQVLALRSRSFIEASRALGASHFRILWKHILPNITGVVIVYLTLTIPSIILYESFLSYLGLGIQPPMASWGSLIADGTQQLNSIRIYWWLIVFPALMLVVSLLSLNFLGDGLRDALAPEGSR
jgi:peptide/nickel transport system permease protein/oligopeptide transport system permease protein